MTGIAVLSLIAVAGFSLAVYAAWLFHDMPDASDLADYRPPTATRVYAWDGTLIGEFSKERRIFVPYDQMPPTLVRAFLAAYWADATHEHMVQPAMVYISYPTEWGTLYTRPELEALHEVCRAYGLLLYMDGARLGYALAAEEHRPENDRLSLVDIARLTDAFYIGGTKVGTLFGEALVLSALELRRDFRYYMKQRGGLLAKGRLLGIQFDVLFSDGLYMEISRHAVDQAMRVREAFRKKGFAFYLDSPTNQQFPILSEEQMAALAAKYSFAVFARLDHGLSAVRFCTSWATRPENVDQLIADIENL